MSLIHYMCTTKLNILRTTRVFYVPLTYETRGNRFGPARISFNLMSLLNVAFYAAFGGMRLLFRACAC